MAFWNIANTPVTVIPAGSLAQADYIFQNTGSNTIYISDQQNVTADATSLAIAAGTPFTWSKSDSLYAVCSAGNPSTLFGTANGAQVGTSIAALLTPTAQYVIAAAANTLYRSTYTLTNGIYTIATTPNTVIVSIDFYDVNGALITSVTSTSGSNLTVNLATTAVQFDYWTTSGTNTSISITKSGSNIPYVSGTLYTYTTSQNIPLSGDAYCILIGAAGGSSNFSGGTGGIQTFRALLTPNMPFVCGTAGTSGNSSGTPLATNGTASTFAGKTSTGGTAGNNGVHGVGGTPNGVDGINAVNGVGNTSSTVAVLSGWAFFSMGSIGSGSCASPYTGGGLGLGVGGNGNTGGVGGNASGYGSSGGGSLAGVLGGLSTGGALLIII